MPRNEQRQDHDAIYCEPAHVPGDWVMERETGELHQIRAVVPMAIEGQVQRFLYVTDDGFASDGTDVEPATSDKGV